MHNTPAQFADKSRTRATVVTTVTAYSVPVGQNVTIFEPSAATAFTATLPHTREVQIGDIYEFYLQGSNTTSGVTIADSAEEYYGINDVLLDTNTGSNYKTAAFIATYFGWVLLRAGA